MSRDDGIRLVSIYHFVAAGLTLLGALISLLVLLVPFMAYAPPRDMTFFVILFGLLFLILGGLALLYLVTGIGLWRRKEWARWVALVLAVLGLLNFPIGTIIGALVIWFLLREDVQAAFRGED